MPGSMWVNSRSREKEPARTRLGGSLTGCEGIRSISITILSQVADSEGASAKASVAPDGKFTVTDGRNGVSKIYAAR